jgi:predicted dehydrogenase
MEVKIGIIGAKFAGDFHAQSWAGVPEAKIYAIADIDDKAREQFATVHNVTKTYGDYKTLLQDPEIDLVDICLPNFLHAEVTIAAMEAGKDVICEKPFATTLEDGERILDVQKKTGRKYFYAEDWIFAPSLVRAKNLLNEGALGKALYLRGKEVHNGSHSPFAQKIKFCGGGSLIHLAVHPIGFFHHLLGMPASVMGKCSGGGENNMVHKKMEGEDWGFAILSYADGTEVTVEGNYVTRGGMDDVVEIYGTEGRLTVDMTMGNPLSVFSMKGYGYAIEKADFTQGWTKPAVDEHQALGYKDELRHFKDCICGDAEQMKGTSAEDGLNVLKIIDAIYRSNSTGKSIDL